MRIPPISSCPREKDRFLLGILYHRTKEPARAGTGKAHLSPQEDGPHPPRKRGPPSPRGGRQEKSLAEFATQKTNQSACFDLERSASGMSMLSRLRGSMGYRAWRDVAIAPYFSFYWKYGATLRSSVPSLKPLFLQFGVMRLVFAGLVRFRNRSIDLLRRDGPCRLPVYFVHWTHLLAWISMTFYLIKAAERRTRFALDRRSFSNFICSTER